MNMGSEAAGHFLTNRKWPTALGEYGQIPLASVALVRDGRPRERDPMLSALTITVSAAIAIPD
jgi:hypothetical protein